MNRYKYFVICLVLLVVAIASISTTRAQTIPNGSQLLEELRNGTLSLSDAATQLSEQTRLSSSITEDLLGDLSENLNISNLTGGELLDGIISGQIPEVEIPNIQGMLDGLSDIINPEAITELVEGITDGIIPPEIGEILGNLEALNEVINLDNIQEIFENPEIIEGLRNILSETGLSSEVLETITGITEVLTTLENIEELGAALIAEAIAEILPADLLALFGGLDGLISSLTSSLSSGTPFEPGEPETGEYEIPDTYNAHSSPVNPAKTVDCASNCACEIPIENNHAEIRKHISDEFVKHRSWFIDELFRKHVLPAMGLMTTQLQTIFVQQTFIIGTFFDAEHQIKKHRLLQRLSAEAHKDYQPSEGLCEIGTNVRSLAASQNRRDLAHTAFANYVMDRQLRSADTSAAYSSDSDIKNRISNFITKYCNKADNSNGLNFLCKHGGTNKARMNKDVDFTRTLESKLTLDIDLSDSATEEDTPDKEDIFALSANLFAHEPLPALAALPLATSQGEPRAMAYRYLDIRSIAAKRSVAQNSFSSIVAERVKGDAEVAPYLKRIVTELGISDEDVEEILGRNPSSLAQKAVLQQKIYQNPVFYTELYDKPANVLRKGVALRAISLMQERDIFESQLRSEMTLAVMLETMLREEHNRIDGQFIKLQEGK